MGIARGHKSGQRVESSSFAALGLFRLSCFQPTADDSSEWEGAGMVVRRGGGSSPTPPPADKQLLCPHKDQILGMSFSQLGILWVLGFSFVVSPGGLFWGFVGSGGGAVSLRSPLRYMC